MATEDVSAERMVLGAAIIATGSARDVAHAAVLSLESSDLTDTRHRVIHAILREMVTKGVPIDSKTVCAELEARGKLNTPGGAGGVLYVFDLAQHVTVDAAPYYADIVRSATRVRTLRNVATQTAQACEREDASGQVDELLKLHREGVDSIPAPINVNDDDQRDYLKALLAHTAAPVDWVIPGWIARQERALIVAGEGHVKTTLLRQFANCVAMGLNPWTGHRVTDGQRVLFIDGENSYDQSSRAYGWITPRCLKASRGLADPGYDERLLHKTRNDGVDLPGKDAQWFIDVAARHSPDLLILGPAYKLMSGDRKDETDVIRLLNIIDKVRVQQNCAVLMETHAGNGAPGSREMRPLGSAVWRAWPEVGLGYQRDMSMGIEQQPRPDHLEAVDFRGQRENRDWPDLITYGDPRNQLPWVPTRMDWEPSVDVGYVIPTDESRTA